MSVPIAPILADLPCIGCGYNLRGLLDQSECPECGLAVHRSLKPGHGLSHRPPQWVAAVARGAALLLIGYLGTPVILALSMLSVFDRVWFARPAVAMIFLLLHAYGAFLITSTEPGWRPAPVRERLWAWALRLCALGPIVALPISFYLLIWSRISLYATWLWALQSTIVACPALALGRLRGLIRRIGRPRLGTHAAIAGCGLSCALAATTLLQAFMWIIIAVMIVIGFYFWSVGILLMAARGLRLAAREARAMWREQPC